MTLKELKRRVQLRYRNIVRGAERRRSIKVYKDTIARTARRIIKEEYGGGAPEHGWRPPGVVVMDDDALPTDGVDLKHYRTINFRHGLLATDDDDRVDIDCDPDGGFGPFVYDILVDADFAAVVAAGTYSEGEEFTAFHGHTFFVYSTAQAGLAKAISTYTNNSLNVSMIVNDGQYNEQLDFTSATGSGDIHIHATGWDRTTIGVSNSAHLLDSSPTVHWYNLTLSAQTGQPLFSGTCLGMRFEHVHFLRSMAGSISGSIFMDCDFERGWVAQAGDSASIDNITIMGGSISGSTGEGFDFETNSKGIRLWNVIGFNLASVNSHFNLHTVAACDFQIRHGATGNWKEAFTFNGDVSGGTIVMSGPISVESGESLIIAKTGTVIKALKVFLTTAPGTGHTAATRVVEGQGTAIYRGCHFDISTEDSGSGQYFYQGNVANVFEGIAENCKFTITPPQEIIYTLAGSTGNIIDSGTAHADAIGIATIVGSFDDAYNGMFLEPFTFVVTEAGGVITGTLDKNPSGDLTERFSDGYTKASSGISIALTAGADDAPVLNYVYILKSNKGVLAKSTSDWPAAEHNKIAEVILQTAAKTQTEGGALVNRFWNDFAKDAVGQGHHLHAWERLRHEHSAWKSGAAITWTIDSVPNPDTVNLAVTAAKIYQLHIQDFEAKDTAGGDNVHVVNDSGTPYTEITDFASLLTDNAGGDMSGRYFNLVVWGSVSSGTEKEHLFVNLPGGSYNRQADALADTEGFTVFDIPADFRGKAFLITRITLRHQAAASGTWTSIRETDLRGQVPNIVAGGGTAAISTEFADNQFKVFDDGNPTKVLAFQADQITAGNTRTLTVPDADGIIALATHADGGLAIILDDDGDTYHTVEESADEDIHRFYAETNEVLNINSAGSWRLKNDLAAGSWITLSSDKSVAGGAVGNNQPILVIVASPHDGAGFDAGAQIAFWSDEAHDATSHGQRIEIYTVPDGSTSVTLAVTIEQDQSLSLEQYMQFTEIATPVNPAENSGRLFTRDNGNNIELVFLSATGDECIICSILNVSVVHTNTLTLNEIE